MRRQSTATGTVDLRMPDTDEFADVAYVVGELVALELVDPERLLLVGARCRDLLHRQLGNGNPTRRTDDIDIGIAVESLDQYNDIIRTLKPSGRTGARFEIGGLPVDIMPFGSIEDPRGTVTLDSRHPSFSVAGFTSVWASAQTFDLGSGAAIRVPRVAGYAVLKAHAFADRSARYETKDAEDLAIVLTWYRKSNTVGKFVYDSELGNEVLELTDFDPDAASAYLLGIDMLQSLSGLDQDALRSAWRSCQDDLLLRRYQLHSPNLDAALSVSSLRKALESPTCPGESTYEWPL
jgi:predicted nucleotidyltransferase